VEDGASSLPDSCRLRSLKKCSEDQGLPPETTIKGKLGVEIDEKEIPRNFTHYSHTRFYYFYKEAAAVAPRIKTLKAPGHLKTDED